MVVCSGVVSETVSAAATAAALLRDTDGRIIYAFNWLETIVEGLPIFTSPASWIASIISQTSPHLSPAFAGNTKFLAGVTGVSQKLNRGDFITLHDNGIAGFENDSDIGIKIRSAVVTQIVDSSKLTITRRRMADFYTNSVGLFLKLYQDAPNSRSNRNAVNGAIRNFDRTLSTPPINILPTDADINTEGAKVLLVDTESLNDDLSIGQGKFFIKLKRRLFSSMRYITLIAEIGETVLVTEVEE